MGVGDGLCTAAHSRREKSDFLGKRIRLVQRRSALVSYKVVFYPVNVGKF